MDDIFENYLDANRKVYEANQDFVEASKKVVEYLSSIIDKTNVNASVTPDKGKTITSVIE